ncbi:Hypothetical protein (Fragment) [Durusdinium trenchii]|uniref:Uncharacterized protein n=1 Tax=Durusdinium trenchii TaxID=1381693 RepID=A0ABP0LCB3_9DINO
MSPKSFDERLSYHVRRFQGKQPRNVLKRYEQRLHVALKSDELQKYAFHVAAWVAELPAEQMYLQYDGLFAVSLLQQYVRSFKQAKPLCEHLTKVLTRVSERLNTDSELGMQWRGLLQDLQHFVPEAKATKGARLMNKAVYVWRNTTCETKQEEYVSSLEESLQKVEADDLCQIRSIFRRAVAALSPPQCMSEGAAQIAPESLQLKGSKRDLQFRLRKVVLACLDYLELSDSKVQPALQLLKSLLGKFQELNAGDRALKIGCRKHWRLLEFKCGMSFSCANTPSQSHNKIRYHCEHNARRDNCRICRPCPHGKLKTKCKQCSPCPHGRLKENCPDCRGCPHGKLRFVCVQCSGCPHGKLKRNCAVCAGCVHGRVKRSCRQCNACVHGRDKYKCRQCKGQKVLVFSFRRRTGNF